MKCFKLALSLLLAFEVLCSSSLRRTIKVRKGNGSKCEQGMDINTTVCYSLESALQEIVNEYNVTVTVRPEEYELTTNFTFGRRVLEFYMNCDGEEPCWVICNGSGTGITFNGVATIKLTGIRFKGCGAPLKIENKIFVFVTLNFSGSKSVILNNIWVIDSKGAAILMLDINSSSIENCNISSNGLANASTSLDRDGDIAGGGGLYIKFTNDHSTSSTIFFNNCTFLSNTGTSFTSKPEKQTSFGQGGGLSISFSGESNRGNNITINDTKFINNQATYGGGGLLLEFYDSANTVNVIHSVFESNQATYGGGGLLLEFYDSANTVNVIHSVFESNRAQSDSSGISSSLKSGGGVKILHRYSSSNTVIFYDCSFRDNLAHLGGGVHYDVEREHSPTIKLNFNDCRWSNNRAWLGSALSLVTSPLTTIGYVAKVQFKNANISNHTQIHSENGELIPLGTIYIDSVPTEFQGKVQFYRNSYTALVVANAVVDFMKDSNVVFAGNRGYNGGAMALLNDAFIRAGESSSLRFTGNEAESKGGAIYAVTYNDHYLISSQQCFIRYVNYTTPPSMRSTTFTFEGNLAGARNNSIFTTSTVPCKSEENETDTLCWLAQNHNCCRDFIETEAAGVQFQNSSEQPTSVNVYPGEKISLFNSFQIIDDLHNDISDKVVFTAKIRNTTQAAIVGASQFIFTSTIQLTGVPNSTNVIDLYTTDSRVVHTEVDVVIRECPTGFTINATTQEPSNIRCECNEKFQDILKCTENNLITILKLRRQWIGLDDDSMLITGYCPYLTSLDLLQMQLSQEPSQVSTQLCSSINRKGTLCGECADEYTPAINRRRLECLSCDPALGWVQYIFLKILPITVLFLTLMLFDVSFTSGPTNAYIFYSQVITAAFLHYSTTIETKSLDNAYTTLYEVWNLDFLTSFFHHCFHIETIHAIALEYIIALYPLVLIILIYFVISLHNKGVCPVVCICRPLYWCVIKIRRHRNLTQFTIHRPLAAFMVLSYTKFVKISLMLLKTSELHNQDGKMSKTVVTLQGTVEAYKGIHLLYVVLALVVLIGVGLVLPLLLVFYQFWSTLDRLSCRCYRKKGGSLRRFLNLFYSCYKDGTGPMKRDTRYFAGLYFIFRFILALLNLNQNWPSHYLQQTIFCLVVILLFSLVQPYKKSYLNTLDAVMFLVLVGISLFSNYNLNLEESTKKYSNAVLVMEYILIFLPLFYISAYLIYRPISKFWKENVSSSNVKFIPSNVSNSGDTIDDTVQKSAENEHSRNLSQTVARIIPMRWDSTQTPTEHTHLFSTSKASGDSIPMSVLSTINSNEDSQRKE